MLERFDTQATSKPPRTHEDADTLKRDGVLRQDLSVDWEDRTALLYTLEIFRFSFNIHQRPVSHALIEAL